MRATKTLLILLLAATLPRLALSLELTILTEDYAPYNYQKNGQVTGFTTDVVKAILKDTGNQNLKIELYPWQRAYRMALNDKNILLYTMTRTEARDPLFKWVGPVAERTVWIWKLKKRQDIVVNTLEDAKKYTITSVAKSAGTTYLKSQGFTDKQLNPIHKESLTVAKFLAGRDDLILKPKLAMAYELNQLGETMSIVEPLFALPNSGSYYLAFSLDTPDSTVKLFQDSFDKLKQNGGYDEIYGKYVVTSP
ncbi:substrate-binding periplasmic protein [Vibrio marisflavi]|uniref:Solute-binding protein family 3/N-terminal domain-containing protein n=1 Tax=Vibrio marisflavi CECT 7928 TaxID=634439 RepID=A0ABN8E0K9_9VIBR|nr:transporter substrate-binding domain-containing protein [Vibrio marisflavi]CAH0537807.1 hypothetical protein VMF7928_01360 [Vibrio marisflavi CECT 7928]